MILFTSFFETKGLEDEYELFSGAVYQPKGYNYEKAWWADIRDDKGAWIRPRNFLDSADPAGAYFERMYEHFMARASSILAWYGQRERDAAVCCWCPHDRAAKRQLEEFGSFICHTGPAAAVCRDLGIEVALDKAREKMYTYGEEA